MKAAFLIAPRRIEIRETPIPQPRRGEVRVRVEAVGVCGSDAHFFEHGRIGPVHAAFPQILGHEPAGIVDAAGPGASLREGTRVAIEPAMPCGKCEY